MNSYKYKKYKSKYTSVSREMDLNISCLDECKKIIRMLKVENVILKDKLGKIYNYNYSNMPEYTKSI